jgi:hypothetical protein
MVMEATGGLEIRVTTELTRRGLPVAVVGLSDTKLPPNHRDTPKMTAVRPEDRGQKTEDSNICGAKRR